jgi:hypothetical protein
MNAVIHHANGHIIRRAIRDFGHKMVTESKHELLSHFTPQDLDEVGDAILEKASDSFLDKALEKRLASIDARSLINALAQAERLGYENNDNLDADNENPSPTGAQLQPQASAPQPFPSQHVPSQASQFIHHNSPAPARTQIQNLQCPLCWRKFPTAAPYEYVSVFQFRLLVLQCGSLPSSQLRVTSRANLITPNSTSRSSFVQRNPRVMMAFPFHAHTVELDSLLALASNM